MEHPILTPIPRQRVLVDTFLGLDRRPRIPAGAFSEMENLTSDHFPVLSPRGPRQLYASPASPQGLIAKEKLCYVDGADFVIGESRYPMDLSVRPEECPKGLTSMGAYVIILPDKKYINTADPVDRGDIEAVYTGENVALSPCLASGEAPPEGVTATHVKLSAPGIGKDFREGDGLIFTGLPENLGNTAVVRSRGEDHLVIPGVGEDGTLSSLRVERRMPRMDFLTQAGNRLWGCRYGPDESGEPVNRLYASALGDFRNWARFEGTAMDSYYVNLGSDGPFTGAITSLGSPLFFKEGTLHQVYGQTPDTFALQEIPCRGVQSGCHGSLAVVGEEVYYLSRSGVCVYDGSLPRVVSRNLGELRTQTAVAGALGGKYYLCMEGLGLYVYDTARDLWHREDHFRAMDFAALEGRLYAIDLDSRNIRILSGGAGEEAVSWEAVTGEQGLEDPGAKQISRLTLRLRLDPGSRLEVFAEYDRSGVWEPLCHIRGTSLRSFSVPVRPRRCDHLRLKLRGQGRASIYAITKTVEKGSEG